MISSGDFDMEYINAVREVNAAVVNVSGRQRMLSQRIALFCLRLVCSQTPTERSHLRQELRSAIKLMEQSHQGLIHGDANLNLPGKLSPALQAMYFEPPVQLDQLLQTYLAEVAVLLTIPDADLSLENPHLQHVLELADHKLLMALDAVVSQYHVEGDQEERSIANGQLSLYEQSCAATAAAKAQTEQLEHALSDLKRTQTQLIQSEKLSTLGQLVAGVAHEINNPVNFIYGNITHASEYIDDLLGLIELYQTEYPNPSDKVQTLIDDIEVDFLSEDLPKLLASMKLGAERIREIVLSLRTFSRIDEAEMKPVDLHEGIDSTLLILQNRLKAKPEHPAIEIIKEYGDLPPVECYIGQMNQVFMNILSNAIDALEEYNEQRSYEEVHADPSYIAIRTEVVDQNAIIHIADNGPGMTAEVKKMLFDPFFTTKPVGQGTGLGLAISQQIVTEKHGGRLSCESEPGKGSAFRIQIPLQQA